jgi:hypothetical protein
MYCDVDDGDGDSFMLQWSYAEGVVSLLGCWDSGRSIQPSQWYCVSFSLFWCICDCVWSSISEVDKQGLSELRFDSFKFDLSLSQRLSFSIAVIIVCVCVSYHRESVWSMSADAQRLCDTSVAKRFPKSNSLFNVIQQRQLPVVSYISSVHQLTLKTFEMRCRHSSCACVRSTAILITILMCNQ